MESVTVVGGRKRVGVVIDPPDPVRVLAFVDAFMAVWIWACKLLLVLIPIAFVIAWTLQITQWLGLWS